MVDTEKISDLHKPGLRSILDILIKYGTFKRLPLYVSAFASVALCLAFVIGGANLVKVLNVTASLVQTVFPGLLGFSLGGYAIAVGFSNTDLIQRSTKTDKHNVYQLLSGIFAMSILLQVIATVIGIVVYWCLSVELNSVVRIVLPVGIAMAANLLILFSLFFSAIYSLILVPYVVTNLFTLSQTNSMYYTVQRYRSEIRASAIAKERAEKELAEKQASQEHEE